MSSVEGATEGYNFVYEKLVDNENDILGIIAYSVYKRQKIEYIAHIKAAQGRKPNSEELEAFRNLTNSDTQLASYNGQAVDLVQSFLEEAINEEAKRLEEFYEQKAQSEIDKAKAELLALKPRFMFGVWQSVVGSVVFVLVLGCLVFFGWSLKQGPKQVIENIFNVRIEDRGMIEAPAPAPAP